MRWFRTIVAGTALVVGFGLTPIAMNPANAGELLSASSVLTVNAGTVLVLANLFQVSPRGAQMVGEVRVFISGGLAFPGGGQFHKFSNLQSMLTMSVIATGVGGNGIVTIEAAGVLLVGGASVQDGALANITIVPVPAPTPTTLPAVPTPTSLTPTPLPETPTTFPAVPTPTTLLPSPTTAPPSLVTRQTPRLEINRPPAAIPISVIARTNLWAKIRLRGEDPEGARLRYSIVAVPLKGRLLGVPLTGRIPRNLVEYQPNYNFAGSDAFSYTVSDGSLTSAPVVVGIIVTSDVTRPTTPAYA